MGVHRESISGQCDVALTYFPDGCSVSIHFANPVRCDSGFKLKPFLPGLSWPYTVFRPCSIGLTPTWCGTRLTMAA